MFLFSFVMNVTCANGFDVGLYDYSSLCIDQRGAPLVNPPEGPCGAGESATSKCDNFDGYLSRDKGCNDLYFSQITKSNVCAAKSNPAKMG